MGQGTFDLGTGDGAATSVAVQAGLFGGSAPEPVSQGQARGAGRPPGSENRINRDIQKVVARHFGGRPVADVMAQLCAEAMVVDPGLPAHQQRNLDRIQMIFGCRSREKAGEMLERLLGRVFDATTPRLQHVKADVRVSAPVIFDMSGTADANAFDDNGDLLDITPNDYNDLDGGAA